VLTLQQVHRAPVRTEERYKGKCPKKAGSYGRRAWWLWCWSQCQWIRRWRWHWCAIQSKELALRLGWQGLYWLC